MKSKRYFIYTCLGVVIILWILFLFDADKFTEGIFSDLNYVSAYINISIQNVNFKKCISSFPKPDGKAFCSCLENYPPSTYNDSAFLTYNGNSVWYHVDESWMYKKEDEFFRGILKKYNIKDRPCGAL